MQTLNATLNEVRQREMTPEAADVIGRLIVAKLRCEARIALLLGLDAPRQVQLETATSKVTLTDIRAITKMLDERDRAKADAATEAARHIKINDVVEVEGVTMPEPVAEGRRLGFADLEAARTALDGTANRTQAVDNPQSETGKPVVAATTREERFAALAESYKQHEPVKPEALVEWEAIVEKALDRGELHLPDGQILTGSTLTWYARVARQELSRGEAHESGRPFWYRERRPEPKQVGGAVGPDGSGAELWRSRRGGGFPGGGNG
jgi:hypothetical protein